MASHLKSEYKPKFFTVYQRSLHLQLHIITTWAAFHSFLSFSILFKFYFCCESQVLTEVLTQGSALTRLIFHSFSLSFLPTTLSLLSLLSISFLFPYSNISKCLILLFMVCAVATLVFQVFFSLHFRISVNGILSFASFYLYNFLSVHSAPTHVLLINHSPKLVSKFLPPQIAGTEHVSLCFWMTCIDITFF